MKIIRAMIVRSAMKNMITKPGLPYRVVTNLSTTGTTNT